MKRHGVVAVGMTIGMMIGCSEPVERAPVPTPQTEARPEESTPQKPEARTAQVAQTEPARAEPVAAAPEPRPMSDRPTWWMDEPQVSETGFAATVEAEGANVVEARAAAVALAMETAARHARAEDARIDKTLIITPRPGVYKAFVHVSCPVTKTAQAPESP